MGGVRFKLKVVVIWKEDWVQKKDRNQRRHLPGWCGPGCWILVSSLGPRISMFVSSASVSSNISRSSNVSFLNESGFSPGFPCQYSIGVITYLKTISSWWRHQNFPTRLLKQGNGNADNPQR